MTRKFRITGSRMYSHLFNLGTVCTLTKVYCDNSFELQGASPWGQIIKQNVHPMDCEEIFEKDNHTENLEQAFKIVILYNALADIVISTENVVSETTLDKILKMLDVYGEELEKLGEEESIRKMIDDLLKSLPL